MKTVRVYYAGIPARNTNQEKRLVLQNFHQGVTDGASKEIESPSWEPSDLAVLQGWVHADSGSSPHLNFRKKVIESQKEIGKHTLAIDSNLFLYRDPQNTNTYLRFSLNDIFPTTGNYFTEQINPDRWQQIKRDLNFDLAPWRENGKHILICCQRNGGWSMGGVGVMQWLNETIVNLQKVTDRPLLVRLHPNDKKSKEYIKNIVDPRIKISKKTSLTEDLQNAWATVVYNSSPAVASAIEGVPIFVTDPEPERSQAYDVANLDLRHIENPSMPDRQHWIEKVSMCHYNFNDLKTGKAWETIKNYL